MSTVRSLVLHAPGRIDVERQPAPKRQRASDVLVRVRRGGLCGTDLHYWRHGRAGLSQMRGPLRLGHELAGEVHETADDGSAPPAGALVVIHPILERAANTRNDVPSHLDPRSRYLGSAAGEMTDGGFSDLLLLPSEMVRAVPEGVSLDTAALAEPLSVAWHAVGQGAVEAGDRVLIVGSGVIGVLIGLIARSLGATVSVADISAPALALARGCGLRQTYALGESAPDDVHTAVFECSGHPEGVRTAIRSAAYRGRVVLVGLQPSDEGALPLATLMRREIVLVSSFRFDAEMDRAIRFLPELEPFAERIVTAVLPMEQVDEALHLASRPEHSGKVLLSFDTPARP